MTCPHEQADLNPLCCADDPPTDPRVLADFAQRDFFVQLVVATNPSAPADALAAMAASTTRRDVAEDVAQHPSTPAAVLRTLAGSGDELVQTGVAQNLAAPTCDQGVRRRVPLRVPMARRWEARRRANHSQAARSTGSRAVYATLKDAKPLGRELNS